MVCNELKLSLSTLSTPLSTPCTTSPPNTPIGRQAGRKPALPAVMRGIGGQPNDPRRPAAGNQTEDEPWQQLRTITVVNVRNATIGNRQAAFTNCMGLCQV